jgi:phosphosulfolactate synthase
MAQYLELEMAVRGDKKPREKGLTMVMDQGWPVDFTDGMLAEFGRYLDIAKLWDPHLLQPLEEVKRKVEVYKKHQVLVQPGGIFLEIARRQGRDREILGKLSDIGFDLVEFSSTTSARGDMQKELELVDYARELGFKVIGEVGRKFADGDETRLTEDTVDIPATIAEFKALLGAGAWKVYWEGHLLREVMGETPEEIKRRAATGTVQVQTVAAEVGEENIIFEVSGLRPRLNRQWLQFWLVRLFGPDVNIGNARIEEMGNLEAIRRGNHPIFGFGGSGNYPWLRSTEDGGASNWWRS